LYIPRQFSGLFPFCSLPRIYAALTGRRQEPPPFFSVLRDAARHRAPVRVANEL